MTTIFSKIIAKEIPAHIVYEDDVCVVIMDKFPSVAGQTLVIPKVETDYAFDLPEDIYQHIMRIAKNVALASDEVFETERTCLVVEGFEVPHVHIKLFPVGKGGTSLTAYLLQTQEGMDDVLAKQATNISKALSN